MEEAGSKERPEHKQITGEECANKDNQRCSKYKIYWNFMGTFNFCTFKLKQVSTKYVMVEFIPLQPIYLFEYSTNARLHSRGLIIELKQI